MRKGYKHEQFSLLPPISVWSELSPSYFSSCLMKIVIFKGVIRISGWFEGAKNGEVGKAVEECEGS